MTQTDDALKRCPKCGADRAGWLKCSHITCRGGEIFGCLPATPAATMLKPDMTPDVYGRVPMVCESGLAMTKASMARLMMFILRNNIELLQIHAFNPNFHGCQVSAAVRIRPDQIPAFEAGTGGKLTKPPTIKLN